MIKKQVILLCCKSILMTGMALNFDMDNDFQTINTSSPGEAVHVLQKVRPAAILVDSGMVNQADIDLFRREYADVPLIALNSENNAAVVYVCQKGRVETINDLKQIIMHYHLPAMT